MLEKTLETPLQGGQPVHSKGDQSWVFIGRTDAKAETPILWSPDAKSWLIWKDPWCWERLRTRGEGDEKGWDGWKASPTQWTWVWVNSRSWWWTGRPDVLQFMGSWRFFLYSSSVYSCHLFLMSSASVRSIPFLSYIEPIFAWNVPLVSLIFLKRSLVFSILLFSTTISLSLSKS